MEIPLDRESATPLYQQIQQHIGRLIRQGTLSPHLRLPATRKLANQLGVNRITVSTAYAELEAAGLVYTHRGKGTFVSPPAPGEQTKQGTNHQTPLWQQALAARPSSHSHEQWYQLLLRAQQPDIISFAAGGPDPSTFPVDHFRKTLQTVLRRDGPAAMDYGDVQGYPPLRQSIADFMREQGLESTADEVLVASGSQQALSLVALALLQPGDQVVVESPTYTNALQLFQSLGAQLLTVPVDHEGLQVDLLKHLLHQHRPRLIYTVPTFHNPTGTTLSGLRRRQLVALAEQHGVPIVEDDYVSGLRYDGPRQPWLKTLDRAGNVIHISTFSKMFMPGPRVGFLLTSGALLERIIALKRQTDLGTSGLIQRALEAYIQQGRWRTHTRQVRRIYHQRRNAMIDAMQRFFPDQAQWLAPKGGFYIWVQLPAGISVADLYIQAIKNRVAFAPGPLFFPDPAPYPAFRLSFSQSTLERILLGVQQLGKVLTHALGREPPITSHTLSQIV